MEIQNDIDIQLCNKLSLLNIDDNNNDRSKLAIVIQKNARRFLTKKRLAKQNDAITLPVIDKLLNNYINNYLFNNEINKNLTIKKIRNQNFPSEISENIVKYAIFNKYKIMPSWNTSVGDLILLNKKIEVKGFMSSGPSSFGPDEEWSFIYFIDCKDFINKNFKVYELKISNKNKIWQSIKINKNETFRDQALNKRRPRISFDELYKQLNNYFNIIFDGNLSTLK